MKTLHRFAYVLLLAIPLFFSSCIGKLFGGDDDDDLPRSEQVNNELQGEWEVTSWRVDGQEFIPAGVRSWRMDFDKDEFDTGEVEWDLDFVDDNLQDIRQDLPYQISEDGEEISISGDAFDIDVDGDEFELDGDITGNNGTQRWQIEAERD